MKKYRHFIFMITVNDLVRDFNPAAELKINIDGENKTIYDIGWKSDDYENTLEGVKRSKQHTQEIYLHPEPEKTISDSKYTKIGCDPNFYGKTISGGWNPKDGFFFDCKDISEGKIRVNEDAEYQLNITEIPYLDSNKIVLSCQFKVKKIFYESALVKELDIKCGHLLTIDYELKNTSTGNSPGSQYATIYNAYNGKSTTKSLNSLANMINEGMEIYRICNGKY